MTGNTRIVRTNSLDPWWNLSIEEYLLDTVEPGQCILYIWQNDNTVVIGRNQNPWKECKAELFEKEGGRIARRLSGGGAVFHDTGNLNFTFIVDRNLYDLKKQLKVILEAAENLGIDAQITGRNDLIADGRKFSGNAYCFKKDRACHHGTLLISSDLSNLSKYLRVSVDKLKAKGIDSVRSRVVNLSELRPELTVEQMAQAIIDAFRSNYECSAPVEDALKSSKINRDAIENLYCKYSSWNWRYGQAPAFDADFATRFAWGEFELGLKLENGLVREATVYSDAMDEECISQIPRLINGCEYNSQRLAERLRNAKTLPDEDHGLPSFCNNFADIDTILGDIAEWLEAKQF